jgi:aminoglycoside 6'-N-acetyltransferase I
METEMVQIGQARLGDFEAALSLLVRFFDEEGFRTPRKQIRRQIDHLLRDPESAVFLAWQQSRPIGVATVTTSKGIELGLSAEMEDLYVLPEMRGKGTGRALIGAVADWCRRRGCSLVSVVVTPEGQATHDLIGYYRAQGFEETGRTLLFHHLAKARASTMSMDRAEGGLGEE